MIRVKDVFLSANETWCSPHAQSLWTCPCWVPAPPEAASDCHTPPAFDSAASTTREYYGDYNTDLKTRFQNMWLFLNRQSSYRSFRGVEVGPWRKLSRTFYSRSGGTQMTLYVVFCLSADIWAHICMITIRDIGLQLKYAHLFFK